MTASAPSVSRPPDRYSRCFLVALCLTGAFACSGPESTPGSDHADEAGRSATHVDIEVLAMRRIADDRVEVELQLSRPVPPLDSARPTLEMGNWTCLRSRSSPSGRLDRISFVMTAAEFRDEVSDRAPLVFDSGPYSSRGTPPPALDKSRLGN